LTSSARAGNATDLLFTLRCKGVRIWVESGQLRYQTPKGALTAADFRELKEHKEALIALLSRQSGEPPAEMALTPRAMGEFVPTTFHQLNWLRGMEGRASIRVGLTILLRGHLDVASLRRSFTELVDRHEALRTRFAHLDGAYEQVVESREFDLEMMDLSSLSGGDVQIEAKRCAQQFIEVPIDVTAGPLFAAALLKLGSDEHVLAVAIDHLVMDGASVGILWRDLWTLYGQAVRNVSFDLPKVSIQLADYAVWQRKIEQAWQERHDAYWRKRLFGGTGVRLARDQEARRVERRTLERFPIGFGEDLTRRLRRLSESGQTTIALTMLAVYVLVLCRWHDVTDLVIAVPGTARLHPGLENTIGFLVSPVMMRVSLRQADRLVDLLKCVSDEYGVACEHGDAGLLPTKHLESVGQTALFGWVPEEYSLGFVPRLEAFGVDGSIRAERFVIDHTLTVEGQDLDFSPWPSFIDAGPRIGGHICYWTSYSSVATVGRLERNLRQVAECLVDDPARRVADLICLP
jgi:hypothetical protein